MVYQTVSIEDVIARVVRAMRLQDTSYISNMYSWIPEALELFRLDQASSPTYDDLKIVFHKAKLPVGLIYISAVSYCGQRLPYGNSVKDIRTPQPHSGRGDQEVWQSSIVKLPVPDGNSIYSSELTKVKSAPWSSAYYQIDNGYIMTSFSDGLVRLYFNQGVVDARGIPTIPDNGDLKEALYLYVRAKMIESGYEDKVFKWDILMDRFETHMMRACAQITMPSPDMMEHRVNTFARFIPDPNYYDNFFQVSHPEPFIDPMHSIGPSNNGIINGSASIDSSFYSK